MYIATKNICSHQKYKSQPKIYLAAKNIYRARPEMLFAQEVKPLYTIQRIQNPEET